MSSIRVGIVFLLLSQAQFSLSADESCPSDGDVQFVCGLENPEDLILVPDSNWVIASTAVSSSLDEGALIAVNTVDFRLVELVPHRSFDSNSDFSLSTSSSADCPGPRAANFQPHGISLLTGASKVHTLFVVGHGEREAIEVFELSTQSELPRLTWLGCIVAPSEVTRFNAVTYLPNGGIAATNFAPPEGEVWEWHRSKGWSEVPGSKMIAPNGVVASDDGKWLFIADWIGRAIIRLSREQEPPVIDRISVGFRVDNLRWARDGSILATGQTVNCESQSGCEFVGTRTIKVNPESLDWQLLFEYADSEFFRMGTVAIEVEYELWLGGLRDGQGIARVLQAE